MMAVELTGTAGQKLQLTGGKTATITFPIAPDLLSQAPSTIPLWSFDEKDGLWKEEGMATKTGTNYVGTVAHFSFWNCDAPFATIKFQATIKDKNNKPLDNAKVVIEKRDTKFSLSGYGLTNEDGDVEGMIPANESLVMEVYNRCGTLLTTQNIGPFSKDADLGTLSLENAAPATVTISGSVVNCKSGAVTNGFVNVALDGSNYRTSIDKGHFSITINRCDATPVNAQVIAVDLGNSQQGPVRTITVTSGPVAVSQLSACGNSTDQFINFTLNNTTYNLVDPIDSLLGYNSSAWTMINGSTRTLNGSYIYINFSPEISTGTKEVTHASVNVNSKSWTKSGTMNVNVTEYGKIGEFIAGDVTGRMIRDSTSNPGSSVPFNCTFRVRRIQ